MDFVSQVYKVELLKRVAKGGTLKLKITYRVTQSLKSLPTKIEQSEQQWDFLIFFLNKISLNWASKQTNSLHFPPIYIYGFL